MNQKIKDFKEDLEALTRQYWGNRFTIIYSSDDDVKILIKKK